MKILFSLFATIGLAMRRIWNHQLLMLCLLAGLVGAVGLLSSIPLYADAVHHRLLQGELTEAGTWRPPFSFIWRYVGTWHGNVAWEDVQPLDDYVSHQSPGIVGLPLSSLTRHVKTDNLRLYAAADSDQFSDREPLLWTSLGFISSYSDLGSGDLERHITVLEGSFPRSQATGDDVQVLASLALADELGLQVGERYVLFAGDQEGSRLPVRIAGIWLPSDILDPFWFYPAESFDKVLLTSEDAFVKQVVPALEEPVALSVWVQNFDGSRVRTTDVPGLLQQTAIVESRVHALLPNTTLDVSPVEALQTYRRAARELTFLLGAFSLPVLAVILYFVALIAHMVVSRSQAEVAILRSRGTTRAQIVGIYALEGLLVGGLALGMGLLLGGGLAQLMGRSRTFLDPTLVVGSTSAAELPIVLTPVAWAFGLTGVVLAVLALVIPAYTGSRHTIVTFRWERARALLSPLWQRYYLDILLLALPAYGWYMLQRQGIPALVGQADDPFSNPLLLLVPALFCFSLALLFARIFPWILGALAWLVEWLPGTTPLLTLRQLARRASQYIGPLLLLSLTLSLAIFSASMAKTLDGHLVDQVYYQVGADMNLAELGQSTEEPEQQQTIGQISVPSESEEEGPRWLFLPVSEHLAVKGVQAATRVAAYAATSNIGGRQQSGQLLGIDRLDFASVAYYRPDFASGEVLGGLMNRLAVDQRNLLVSREFMARHGLVVGDPLRLAVSVAGDVQEIDFQVAGPIDLFPTLYPQDGPFFVGNLDYVFAGLGGTYPYNVWLAVDAGVSGDRVVAGVRELGLNVVASADAREIIASEQVRPERQGLFGLLSVGFFAAAILTVLGFLVYAIVSFQRRFIELGMLRAVGLSVGQMAAYLAGEQAMLILSGGILGTALGIGASSLFIPYLQSGTGKMARIPPFVVQIAWQELWIIYAVFGVMFVVAVLVLIVLLVRMRIFEAVKLGEVG